MIVAGLGVGPLPVHAVKRDLRDGLLWQLPPFENLPEIDVQVVWNPATRFSRAEQTFLDRILSEVEATPLSARTYR